MRDKDLNGLWIVLMVPVVLVVAWNAGVRSAERGAAAGAHIARARDTAQPRAPGALEEQPQRGGDTEPGSVLAIAGPAGADVARLSLPQLALSMPLDSFLDADAFDDALAQVTPEGLLERTGDWWNQDDFLALTGDELAALLPEENEYALGGKITLLELVGGMPTIADCHTAFESQDVRAKLQVLCSIEIVKNCFYATNVDRRAASWQSDFNELLVAYRAAEMDLMRALERATGYPHWSFLQRAFVAWGR